MLTKPPFFPAARPINAAKRGYSTDSTTYGIQRGSHRWGGRECTDRFIQSCRPSVKGTLGASSDELSSAMAIKGDETVQV